MSLHDNELDEAEVKLGLLDASQLIDEDMVQMPVS